MSHFPPFIFWNPSLTKWPEAIALAVGEGDVGDDRLAVH